MYNLNVIDKVGMPHVMSFITEKLAEFECKCKQGWAGDTQWQKTCFYADIGVSDR